MRYTDIKDYVDSLENLRKIEFTVEDDEETTDNPVD